MSALVLPNFVVIEGVDGVGKTTLARRFEKDFGYKYVYPVPSPYDLIRKQVEGLGDVEARFWYYLAGNVTLQRELRKIIASGMRVILDRYIYSTMASHRAMGATVDCIELSKVPYMVPGLAILLTCASQVRNMRIVSRGLETRAYVDREGSILDETERLLRGYSLKVIDTTKLTEEQVFATAQKFLVSEAEKEELC